MLLEDILASQTELRINKVISPHSWEKALPLKYFPAVLQCFDFLICCRARKQDGAGEAKLHAPPYLDSQGSCSLNSLMLGNSSSNITPPPKMNKPNTPHRVGVEGGLSKGCRVLKLF